MTLIDSFQFQVLDCLVNGPSSVAALYNDLVYLLDYEATVLAPLRRALEDLEDRGWAIARSMRPSGTFHPASRDEQVAAWAKYVIWLPHADRESLAVDESGLWYGITEAGRKAWGEWAGDRGRSTWELDDDANEKRISIVAKDEKTAGAVLAHWLRFRDAIRPGRQRVEPVCQLELSNGTRLATGVRLTCWYDDGRAGA